jgi:hypothetical protein
MAKNSSQLLPVATNKACGNPVCQGAIDDLPQSNKKVWRRTPRKYCSNRCKREGWILAQAAKILFKLEPAEWWKILHAITDHQRARNSRSDTTAVDA